jgi:hypothetical protein
MDTQIAGCEHHWRYFVNLESRAVRIRECEKCRRRAAVPVRLEPIPRRHPAVPATRLSA